jgi:hypothetical protein
MNNEHGRSTLTGAVKQSLIQALKLRKALQTKELARQYGVPVYLINRLSTRLNAERRAQESSDGAGTQLQLF